LNFQSNFKLNIPFGKSLNSLSQNCNSEFGLSELYDESASPSSQKTIGIFTYGPSSIQMAELATMYYNANDFYKHINSSTT